MAADPPWGGGEGIDRELPFKQRTEVSLGTARASPGIASQRMIPGATLVGPCRVGGRRGIATISRRGVLAYMAGPSGTVDCGACRARISATVLAFGLARSQTGTIHSHVVLHLCLRSALKKTYGVGHALVA